MLAPADGRVTQAPVSQPPGPVCSLLSCFSQLRLSPKSFASSHLQKTLQGTQGEAIHTARGPKTGEKEH